MFCDFCPDTCLGVYSVLGVHCYVRLVDLNHLDAEQVLVQSEVEEDVFVPLLRRCGDLSG